MQRGSICHQTPDVVSDVIDLWRLLTLRNEGRFFANSSLVIDVAQKYDKATAHLNIILKNVSTTAIGQLRVSVPGHGLPNQEHVEVHPVNELPASIKPGEEAKHQIQVQCHGPFAHAPRYTLEYVEGTGARVLATLALPTIMTKFLVPVPSVSLTRFKQLFETFGTASESVIVGRPSVPPAQWKDYLEKGFNLLCLPESTPALAFAIGDLYTGAPGAGFTSQVLSVPCMVLLQQEEGGQLMRIAARSQYGSFAERLLKILESHMVEGEKSTGGGRLRLADYEGLFSDILPAGLPSIEVVPAMPLTQVPEDGDVPLSQLCQRLQEERDYLLQELRMARRQASKEQAMLSMELPKKRQVRFDPEVNTPMDFQFTMAALRDVQEERKDLATQLNEAKYAMEQMSAELQVLRQAPHMADAPMSNGGLQASGEAQIKMAADLDSARAEVSRVSEELRTAKELLQWATSQIEAQKVEVEAAQQQRNELLEASAKWKQEHEELLRLREAHSKTAALGTAQADVTHLSAELRASQESQQQAMRQIEDLQAQVAAAHRQRSEFIEASAKWKQEHEELLRLREVAREMQVLREERSAALEQAQAQGSISAERDKLLASLQSLSKEHTNLSIQLDESRQEVSRLQSKLGDASKESTSAAQLHQEHLKLHAECERVRADRDVALQKQSQLSASLERVSRQAEQDIRALTAERDVLAVEKEKSRQASADVDLAALKDDMKRRVHETDAAAREAELIEALTQQRAAHSKQLSQLQQILEVRSKADKAAREATEASARHRIEALETELAKLRKLSARPPQDGGCFGGLLGH